MKTISAHFWRHLQPTWNFGEALVPLILNHLGYQWSVERHTEKPTLLMIGSELRANFINQLRLQGHTPVVWGFGWSHSQIPKGVDIRAVRGPLTASKMQVDCPQGDPGFLVSRAFPRQAYPESGKVLYAPHWHNRKLGSQGAGETFFDVEVKAGGNFASIANAQFRIDQLCSAEFVMTSSLHVAITCIAYKIPFAPAIRHPEQIDKPNKWADVSAWLGSPLEFSTTDEAAHDWWERVGSKIEVPVLSPLVDSFPHEIAHD
jgi:hypothetical protein